MPLPPGFNPGRDMENTTGSTPEGTDLSLPDHTPGIGGNTGNSNPAPLPDTPDVEGDLEETSRTGRQIESGAGPDQEV